MSKKKDKLAVHTVGAPVLRDPTRKIVKITPSVKDAVKKMWSILEKVHGAGLSAPQIGISKKIIIVNIGKIGQIITLFNPEIIWHSENYTPDDEGCLSISGALSKVWRPDEIKVKGMTINGKIEEIEADGIFSKALQHEIDHINGILMIDYSPAEDRRKVLDYFKVDPQSIEYELLKNDPIGPPLEKCVAKPLIYDATGVKVEKKATLYSASGKKI